MKYRISEGITGFFVILLKKILSIFSLKIRYKIFENFGVIAYYLIKKKTITYDKQYKECFS